MRSPVLASTARPHRPPPALREAASRAVEVSRAGEVLEPGAAREPPPTARAGLIEASVLAEEALQELRLRLGATRRSVEVEARRGAALMAAGDDGPGRAHLAAARERVLELRALEAQLASAEPWRRHLAALLAEEARSGAPVGEGARWR